MFLLYSLNKSIPSIGGLDSALRLQSYRNVMKSSKHQITRTWTIPGGFLLPMNLFIQTSPVRCYIYTGSPNTKHACRRQLR